MLWVTFLIFHIFQLMCFTDCSLPGRAASLAMPGLSCSRLPLILHALPRGLTIVFFMNNLFSPHQAVCVTLQPPAL